LTDERNGNERIWWIVGGFATLLTVMGSSAVGYAVRSTAIAATNTNKITQVERRLERIDNKLDRLLARP